jgi:endo-1,4-beta-xylanase
VTARVAVELGMQPLDVINVIEDWIDQDSDLLAHRLRAVMTPGELVLVHDGGGDRAGSVAAITTVVDERLAHGWSFTLPAAGF